jgi:hypothetical protein
LKKTKTQQMEEPSVAAMTICHQSRPTRRRAAPAL